MVAKVEVVKNGPYINLLAFKEGDVDDGRGFTSSKGKGVSDVGEDEGQVGW